MLNPLDYVKDVCRRARAASTALAAIDSETKDVALVAMASKLRSNTTRVLAANQDDLAEASRGGQQEAFLDRLRLTEQRIEQMATGLEEIANLRDPVGEVVSQWRRPGGLEVGQVRIPIGVVGIVFESRPNVTADASGLCFKSGNAVILRGGSEALNSNRAIVQIIRDALAEHGIDPDAVQILDTPSREAVGVLLRQDELVDLVIPRGGKELIRRVVEEARVPVIKHYEGICHVFVHRDADMEMALSIAVNAKVQRPGTCNSMETLLVDHAIASEFLPRLGTEFASAGVEIRGCPETAQHIAVSSLAGEADYRTEYLALICNVRVVSGLEEAIAHIQEFGSNHTDAIVTNALQVAQQFVRRVDSSSVMVNASPRLADGGIYGLGAEIGISTDKLHAYGPMGVTELTTRKFVVYGQGSLRQ